MSFSDADFSNVDEALPIPPTDPLFVAVPRPAVPIDDEDIHFSDSDSEQPADVTGHFGAPPKEDIVEKLYLKKQLRDNALSFKRKELEYLEMRDCTFQPNLHLHTPEANPEKFLQTQEIYEIRRKARMDKLLKEREAKQAKAEQEELRPRPELSPGTRRLTEKMKDARSVTERLMSPRQTPELLPEVSYSYHPLVSPKARSLKRESDNVHEDLYRKQKKPPKDAPAPKPPLCIDSQSEAIVLSQFRKEFKRVSADLDHVEFEQFKLVLLRLKIATERDQQLIEESWKLLSARSGSVDIATLCATLEDVVVLHRSSTADSEETRMTAALQQLFARMHRERLGSPSKFHVHEDPFKYQPTIDPASRKMVSRSDFLASQQHYEETLEKKRQRRATQDQQKFLQQCSFVPKVNKYPPVENPVLKRLRSASPTDLTATSPRYAVLYQYGQQICEERRLLSPPDRDFEANKAELTFSPRKFASISPKRAKYPTDYERTVERLKAAFEQHEELARHFARGIELKGADKK